MLHEEREERGIHEVPLVGFGRLGATEQRRGERVLEGEFEHYVSPLGADDLTTGCRSSADLAPDVTTSFANLRTDLRPQSGIIADGFDQADQRWAWSPAERSGDLGDSREQIATQGSGVGHRRDFALSVAPERIRDQL